MKETITTFFPPGRSRSGLITNGRSPVWEGNLPPVEPERVQSMLGQSLIVPEDWEALAEDSRDEILRSRGSSQLLSNLVHHKLLTQYQAGRIDAGTTFGLVLGNYRVLDRLGAGGMGVVFRAEHIKMRKQVAIKVLPVGPSQDPRLLQRFFIETRAVSQLQHPNIVGAFDVGETASPEDTDTILHFFVMEYVPGQDLEQLVRDHGPLPVHKTCDLIYQVASALAEAHKHNLVHRDIKPSNIQVTPEGQAKLLDFGLARRFRTSMTEPGTLLGTLDYVAPEQVQNASRVDIRGDLYALGGVMYWCLTGKTPFNSTGSLINDLAMRLTQPAPSLSQTGLDLPADLNDVLKKLMAIRAEDRYPHPQAAMRALLPFLRSSLVETQPLALFQESSDTREADGKTGCFHVLLVDDEAGIRNFGRFVLQTEGLQCDEAGSGNEALEMIRNKKYDLVLLDVNMPALSGPEVCQQLRQAPPWPNLKIIMASGNANVEVLSHLLLSGADDFLTKPFSISQLKARIKAALRLKQVQDRNDSLQRHLRTVNHELEKALHNRQSDIVDARNALVLALAKLVEQRASETGAHLLRMQDYVRCLATEAARSGQFGDAIDENLVDLLVCCVPLHDIGKVALPDHILMKPGKLDKDERQMMQTHTIVGAETLQEVARTHGSAMAFLHMAIDVARSHHERYDGTGYPDRLVGESIPLPGRIVAIADVYDALRSRKPYKPGLSHAAAVQIINEAAASQFDPALVKVFHHCAADFERIFRDNPD
ncbi:MAG: response regulator [Planctomycetes bacterium]|nr:response regulator [Planctomycetota bacterium]